ncbi:MAG: hypothetical protein WAM85_21750 [Terracidiphilus sp.]
MNQDRRIILSLVAMGRVTPREAERLLVALSNGDEITLRLAVCLAVAWVTLPQLHELLVGLGHSFNALVPGLMVAGHHALTFCTHWFGGIL